MTNLTSTLFKHDGSDPICVECLKEMNLIEEQRNANWNWLKEADNNELIGFDKNGDTLFWFPQEEEGLIKDGFTILTPSEFLQKIKEK
jgi:hypothetical protein